MFDTIGGRFTTTDEKKSAAYSNSKISCCYEYLDHTADVQLHAWGPTMQDAFRNVVVAMFGYMTNLDLVERREECRFEVRVEGHDRYSLLYNFLTEWLYLFGTKDFICCHLEFHTFDVSDDPKERSGPCVIHATGTGDLFDLRKHEQGTEIKAITYSNMQICDESVPIHLYVIVDI